MILHGSPAPYRASFRSGEWLVEMFVHTEATWHSYVDREVRKRRSPLLWMCSDGLLLFDTDGGRGPHRHRGSDSGICGTAQDVD